MTTHIYGEDSYVECDRFYVVNTVPYENYKPKFRPEHQCYCGADCVQQARVAFMTYKREEGNRRPWPESSTLTYKAHRCEEHRFGEEDGS
jgi:hypothetical protein